MLPGGIGPAQIIQALNSRGTGGKQVAPLATSVLVLAHRQVAVDSLVQVGGGGKGAQVAPAAILAVPQVQAAVTGVVLLVQAGTTGGGQNGLLG